MAKRTRELTVFVSSPSDLSDERAAVVSAAEAVNVTLGAQFGLRLSVVLWEQIQPGAGRPQSLINPHVDECDVFIGMLRRRFGSDTGTHPSGFQEEFERALARQAEERPPKIALYFARIPEEARGDAGPELARVLAFEQRIRDERIALYGQFDGSIDLRQTLQTYFTAVLAEEAAAAVEPPRALASSSVREPPRVAEATGPLDEARSQVGMNLSAWGGIVLGQVSDVAADRDRLLSFALAVNPDREPLPVHTANRLYGRRKELAISVGEGDLWLRTMCTGGAVSPERGSAGPVPGWYFFPHDSMGEDLASLALEEGEPWQSGAIDFLRVLRLKPSMLWPSPADSSAIETDFDATDHAYPAIVDRWQLLLTNHVTRSPAVDYLHAVALPSDQLVGLLISRLHGADSTEEASAALASLGGDQQPAVSYLLDHPYSTGEWLDAAVRAAIPSLEPSRLADVVVGRHRREALRRAAFDRFLALPDADDGDGTRLIAAMLHGSIESREHLFERVTYDLERPREWLAAAWAGTDKEKREVGIEERVVANTTAPEVLLARCGPGFEGHRAFIALSFQRDADLADDAREVLRSGGDSFLGEHLEALGPDHEHLRDWLAAQARVAALRILTFLPAERREPGDVESVRKEVARAHWATVEQAVRALAELAQAQDAPALISGARTAVMRAEGNRRVLEAACREGGREIIVELLADEDERFAEAGALAMSESATVTELTELLYSRHARVRRVAADTLVARLDRTELSALLDAYPETSEASYYYDVVVRLDWELFGRTRAPATP